MKKMTTLVLALFTSAAIAGAANAAPSSHPATMANRIVDNMTRNLDLTAEQQTKLKAIFEEEGKKVRAVRADTRAKVDQVLTPEQKAKAKQLREERIKKWKERRQEWKKEHGKTTK